jgi:selenophosphate synthetase-related protein
MNNKVVIYVHWDNEEILKEAEYEAKLEDEANALAADDYEFGQWLNEYYSANYIWDMSEEEKEKIKADWLEHCRNNMGYELGYERRVLM